MNFVKPPLKIMKNTDMGHIFDLETYPIHQPDHQVTQDLIKRCQTELDAVGCAVIRNLIKPESLSRMQEEATQKMDQTYWSENSHNPYFTADDETFPEGHPKRFFELRESGFINSDLLDENSDLNEIFDSQIMLDFIRKCLNLPELHCWADPLGNHPYAVMQDNHYFPWHFDGNDFTVSILVQQSDEGGDFEYAPDIRNRESENFDKVKDVLNGGRENVYSLTLRPGDMQIFKGRFSMHRVTRVKGSTPRIIALPTYATDPYTVNRPARAKSLYGRTLPIHHERENHRPDTPTD